MPEALVTVPQTVGEFGNPFWRALRCGSRDHDFRQKRTGPATPTMDHLKTTRRRLAAVLRLDETV